VQDSATSQLPALARHTAPAWPGPADLQTGTPVVQSSVPLSQGLPVPQLLPGTQVSLQAPSPSQ